MPNHIQNRVTFECSEERLAEILSAIAKDDVEAENGRSGPGTIDFEKIIPMPENIFRGNLGQKERELYGSDNWYDWSISHWGTKWNSYSNYSEGHTISFQTAWSAPHPVLERLAEMFPDVTITHKWADEDIGMNCGEHEYADGVRVSEYYPEGDVESLDFACAVWDYAPEEIGLTLNSDGTRYINTDYDDYELIELFGKPALFTNERLSDEDVPKGFYHYDFRESDDGSVQFATLEPHVLVNHGGSVITREPIDFGEKEYIELNEDNDPNFVGIDLTLGQYMRGEFNTLIVELPCGNLDLQMKLMSIGVRQPPNQIHLFGTEDDEVHVQLASNVESVQYLPTLFCEDDTLARANVVTDILSRLDPSAFDEIAEGLREDRYETVSDLLEDVREITSENAQGMGGI